MNEFKLIDQEVKTAFADTDKALCAAGFVRTGELPDKCERQTGIYGGYDKRLIQWNKGKVEVEMTAGYYAGDTYMTVKKGSQHICRTACMVRTFRVKGERFQANDNFLPLVRAAIRFGQGKSVHDDLKESEQDLLLDLGYTLDVTESLETPGYIMRLTVLNNVPFATITLHEEATTSGIRFLRMEVPTEGYCNSEPLVRFRLVKKMDTRLAAVKAYTEAIKLLRDQTEMAMKGFIDMHGDTIAIGRDVTIGKNSADVNLELTEGCLDINASVAFARAHIKVDAHTIPCIKYDKLVALLDSLKPGCAELQLKYSVAIAAREAL